MTVPVLHQRDPERDVHVTDREETDRRDQLRKTGETLAVKVVGAFLLSEPDRDHLHETGFDRPVEIGVWLYSTDRNDHVRLLVSNPVEEDRDVALDGPELD